MNKYRLWCLIVFSLVASAGPARAQVNVRDSVFSFSFGAITGGFQIPSGDMADRFGSNFNIGASLNRKLHNNWVLGFEGNFLFGDQVKERQFLVDLATSQGYLITKDGTYGDVLLYERGWQLQTKFGKIIPLIGPNDNSGILLLAGAGFIQHKIRIENQGAEIPYLEGDYAKGYDKLTNGWTLSGFAGYANFGNRKRINFFIGLEYMVGMTESRRDFDYDTRGKDELKRSDILYGLKAGWIIPFYKKLPNAFYYD